MKKLLTTTAVIAALSFSGIALANHHEDGMHKGPPPHMEEALQKLPEAKRELVKSSMEAGREAHKAQWDKIKQLRDEAEAILTAPTFDRSAFIAKNNEIHALHGKMHAEKTTRIADVAAKLTAEERKVLAEMHPGKRKWHKKGHRKMMKEKSGLTSPDAN